MRRVNWRNSANAAKDLKKKINNIESAGDYLNNKPELGYFRDNISKNMVKIEDAKSSSLRRIVKVLDKYYVLVTSPKDKEFILAKKIEIETELNSRDDGLIVKEEDNR
jgi:hypothetical protein